MNRKILFAATALVAALSLFGQVSVFDAGNLNSENPYGLTDNEKELLKNKRSVQNIQGEMSSVTEQLQGLQSVIEGMNARMSKLEQRLVDLEMRVSGDVSQSGTSLESLKKEIAETKALQESNYQKITKTLNQLGALIDKKSNQPAPKLKSDSSITPETQKPNFSKKDNKTIMSEAQKLLNSNKDSEAKEYFEHLASKKYQPAATNYYLGEIAYRQKSYSEAIKYYQKSIEQGDGGSHVPRLLYHTAISFDKVGDTASANKFYKALKAGYPDSKEAQASPNRN